MLNYTLYKNNGFWLDNSRCIFRVFLYLGLISFIFTAAEVFASGFNFCSLCAVVFAKTYFAFLPSRASNRQIHSEYFFSTFIRMVPWLIKIWNPKCSDVKDLTFFTLACLKPPNSFGILQALSDIRNRNTTTVPSEWNSSKRPIVFNNCQVTSNKNKIFLKKTNKRYYLLSQCSK